MSLSRRQFCSLGCLGLFGCGTTTPLFQDGSSVPPDRALVLVHLHYAEFLQQKFLELEVGLTRLEAGKPPEDIALASVPNHRIALIEVPAGQYFLRLLRSGNGFYRHTFEPRLTLFAARPGQVNYPGDWSVAVSIVRGPNGLDYQIRMQTLENETVPALLAREYPKLNTELPLRITRTL